MTDSIVNTGVPSGFKLGTLCKRGHEYLNTGKSLRYNKPTDYGCRQCRLEQSATWKKDNPEGAKAIYRKNYETRDGKTYSKIRSSKRRATIKQVAIEAFTPKELHDRYALFGNACAYCGKRGNLTADHFIAIASGGAHSLSNIVPACGICNRSKGTKNAWTWYTRQPFMNYRRWSLIEALT